MPRRMRTRKSQQSKAVCGLDTDSGIGKAVVIRWPDNAFSVELKSMENTGARNSERSSGRAKAVSSMKSGFRIKPTRKKRCSSNEALKLLTSTDRIQGRQFGHDTDSESTQFHYVWPNVDKNRSKSRQNQDSYSSADAAQDGRPEWNSGPKVTDDLASQTKFLSRLWMSLSGKVMPEQTQAMPVWHQKCYGAIFARALIPYTPVIPQHATDTETTFTGCGNTSTTTPVETTLLTSTTLKSQQNGRSKVPETTSADQDRQQMTNGPFIIWAYGLNQVTPCSWKSDYVQHGFDRITKA